MRSNYSGRLKSSAGLDYERLPDPAGLADENSQPKKYPPYLFIFCDALLTASSPVIPSLRAQAD